MAEDVREFVASTEREAVERAVGHFGVPREQLEIRVISEQVQIAGLAGRVMVLAGRVETPVELSPLGEFVAGVLDRMGLEGKTRVDEREDEGVTQFRISGAGVQDLTRRVSDAKAALTHVAQRAAEQHGDAGSIVRIEFEESRGDGGRQGRDRGRDRGGGRDRERRGGRERGRGRDRHERSGRDGDGRRETDEQQGERLAQLARERAAEVLETGEEALTPPLNSRERWFVHQALNEVDGVRSESAGEGRLKRIKIVRE